MQIFLAGYGVFASAEGATEHKFVDNFAAHAAVGWLLGLLGFILLGLALGAGLPAAVRKLNGLLFLLLVLQFAFAGIGPSVAPIGGLHALNAVVILLVGWLLLNHARETKPPGSATACAVTPSQILTWSSRSIPPNMLMRRVYGRRAGRRREAEAAASSRGERSVRYTAVGVPTPGWQEEAQMATPERRIGGISVGGIIVIVGIVMILFVSLWIGVIVTLIGLIAFGGFARGRWY